ncbi:DUF3054 domain-containing protein [Georgenia sp. Z1491]|uniref:DUF3054 domain-containing protein n=1 Tax=Georgenia sp. Z1491 TaxID=3416707 RepID=UPI003CF2B5B7
MTPVARRRGVVWWALLLDVAVVAAFTLGGADAHERGAGDLARIAWPFLAALAITWVAGRLWRAPTPLWPTGMVVWVGTLGIGMALRALTGGGTAWTFVLVAAGLFAAGFLGWRLVVLVVRRATRPGSDRSRP